MCVVIRTWAMLAAFALAGVPAGARAHHSFAGFYDPSRIVEVEGVLTSIDWRNPHGAMTMEVVDDSGVAEEWQIETGSISVLRVRGLDREFVSVGDRVKLAGEAALRRDNALYARNMLLPTGEEVLLSIGIAPRWTDAETGELLEAEFDETTAANARRDADGIFRVWSTIFEDPDSFPMFKGGYPLTEEARARKAEWNPSDVVLLGCEPKGMPSLMITPYPIEFTRAGNDIVIKFEEDNAERVIHMSPDARRPAGYSSLLGYSTGHWDGSTLVVETAGSNSGYFDSDGTPQGPNARFVEKFMVNDVEDRLDYEITIDDAETFTEVFELRRYFVWRPELSVNPYECVVTGP